MLNSIKFIVYYIPFKQFNFDMSVAVYSNNTMMRLALNRFTKIFFDVYSVLVMYSTKVKTLILFLIFLVYYCFH